MFPTLYVFLTLGMKPVFADDPPASEPPSVDRVGTKGAWGEEIKSTFVQSCTSSRPANIDASIMKNICQCAQKKLESLYAPSELETPEATKTAEEIGAACAMGSVGAWSDLIKTEFMQACEGEKPEGITAPQMKNICSCSMQMIESNYAPIDLQSPAATKFSEQAGEICAKKELNK